MSEVTETSKNSQEPAMFSVDVDFDPTELFSSVCDALGDTRVIMYDLGCSFILVHGSAGDQYEVLFAPGDCLLVQGNKVSVIDDDVQN